MKKEFPFDGIVILVVVLVAVGWVLFNTLPVADDGSENPPDVSALIAVESVSRDEGERLAEDPEEPVQNDLEALLVKREPPDSFEPGLVEPDRLDPSTAQAFEEQLGCLEQVMDAPYQPVSVAFARFSDVRTAAQADRLTLRARLAHFEGLLGLSHPRNYSDYSRLARIVGAAERQGHAVVACVLDREREQGKQKEK